MRHEPWVVNVTCDLIDVTSNFPQLDPGWSHTDSNGHVHRYGPDQTLPTLRWVETYTPEEPGTVYVDADGDEWNDEPEGYYVCATCGERVTPGTYIDRYVQHIQGPVNVDITGWLDGRPVRLVAVEDPTELLDHLRTTDDRDATIEAWARSHPHWVRDRTIR